MKKNNITYKLFKQIGLIILVFSAIIIISNSLLLKPIYFNVMESTLTDAVKQLSRLDYNDSEDLWLDRVETIDSGNNFDIVIFNYGVMMYSSSSEVGVGKVPKGQLSSGENENSLTIDREKEEDKDSKQDGKEFDFEWTQLENGIYTAISVDERSGSEIFQCMTDLNNGIRIITSQAIEPMNESIAVANKLYLGITGFFFLIVLLIILRISKQFTRPIKDIQEQVAHIAKLDFSNKEIVETGDELQNLSEDVILLSDKLEESLNRLTEQNVQLEKDIESQKKFLSNASHELRTPLSLIKGYAEEVKAGYITDPKQQMMIIEYITEESTKMSRLLNEILDLSRLESGRMDFNCFDQNVLDTVENFIDKYDGYISAKDLKVEVDIDPDLTGNYDMMRFEQVLANYISNAAKYSDEDKRIRIYANRQSSNAVVNTDVKNIVRVNVFNSGKPIHDKTLEHIWDDFYKADEARTSDNESFGLGLSIVKAIQTIAGMGYGAYNLYDGVVFWFDIEEISKSEEI